MKRLLATGAAALLLVGLATGCADKRKETKVLRENVMDKALVPESADYLYVPSVMDSPRTTSATRPHWMGDGKRVRFKFAENELIVYEIETDGRFDDNPTNQKPVMAIPITHKDYKCSEDAYGDCTPNEVENSDITWDHKRYFQPRFDQARIQEVNFLPIEITNLFANCYQEVGSEFVGYTVEANAINFQVEKTFRSSIYCAESLESLSDLTFNVRYNYSFLKLDAASSPDYKPLDYPTNEENMFGYFTTRDVHLDVDNNDVETNETYRVNRWNPNRATIDYYLSDAFMKPENAKIREVTQEAVQVLNNSLRAAGARSQIVLHDADRRVQSGDIRHSMIILVEDPQSSGIIGYGPSVANPITGEIISARTVMYMGTMKKYIKWTYDEILRDHLTTLNTPSANFTMASMERAERAQDDLRSLAMLRESGENAPEVERAIATASSARVNSSRSDRIVAKARELVRGPQMSVAELARNPSKRLSILTELGYPGEMFNFRASAASYPNMDDLLKLTGSKPWAELSTSVRQQVVDILMPYTWLPVLIHEMGHNLGLRHNFAGSEDKDNFYTPDEMKNLGFEGARFPYSSVMDYGYKTTNELRVMGKYDVAALRYAYAEKIEKSDGSLISIDDFRRAQNTALKPYAFCTDEHVGSNPNCNRFDEGTNLVEMSNTFIESYLDRYKRSNFRNGRRNFSLYSDISQLGYLEDMMGSFRASFERFEYIRNAFAVDEDDPIWSQIDWLKDLKDATLIGGNFMMDVLKVPDVMCAVAAVRAPTQIIGILPLSQISPSATTCFDEENVQLNPAYMIVGEGGKSFHSKKSPSSINPYLDQIDVRGIWLDKMTAAKYLFARTLDNPIYDRYTDNYLHIRALRPQLEALTQSLIKDEFEGDIPFRMNNGQEMALKIGYGLADQHVIDMPLDSFLKEYLELPNEPIQFQHQLLRIIGREVPSRLNASVSRPFIASIAVYKNLDSNATSGRQVQTLDAGAERFFAFQENTTALDIMARTRAVRVFSGIAPAQLEAAIQKFTANPAAVPANAAEQAVKDHTVALAQAYVDGALKSEDFYVATLREMSELPR